MNTNQSNYSTPITKLVKNTEVRFSENAQKILEKRYLRRDHEGKPIETAEQMFDRIASTMAEPDRAYRDVEVSKIEFYNLLSSKRFFPNSPTFTGAGTDLGQLAACFVLPIEDDLGRSRGSIFETLRVAALIQQTGGGNGFSFSKLRPKGTIVSRSNGKATGPVGFLEVYDAAFGEVAQGGVRRGANMAVLRVDHPDVRDFIKCKSEEGKVANFNISVAITDTFMEAVKKDTTYDFIDPHSGKVAESPRARDIFNMIVDYAYKNGEPGVLFIDAANRTNPVPHKYSLDATNPCGEQWLGPYENCCLGSINLAAHTDINGKLNWDELKESIILSTRFLDNVVSANKYVPDVPELREAAEGARRIGLGIMGLADLMYSMGIRYGSDEGQEFSAQIMEFVRYYSMKTSIELSKERGPFKHIKGSIYDPENLVWTAPTPLKPFKRDFGRPRLNWEEIVEGIKAHGIRNAAQTTVAPTGTISTVAGIEGYGCEPVFALAYMRNVYQAAGDQDKMTLYYVSPMFQQAIDTLALEPEVKQRVIEQVVQSGTCQFVEELPAELKDTFVVSGDITPEEHIMMQTSIQAFIDNSISKTCNFPESASKEDVAKAYMMGWELGAKGLTVYVTGSRSEVVLETKETKSKKDSLQIAESTQVNFERGYKLAGATYKVYTPQGKAFITINKDENAQPVEVFLNVGKAGSDVAALSEALGRLISGWLMVSRDSGHTAKEIVSQLMGIGGAKSVGFGKNRISSLPDAVAKVLAEDMGFEIRNGNGHTIDPAPTQEAHVEEQKQTVSVFAHTDMCPECGNSTLVQEEGCAKCYNCGYSVC